MTSVAKKTRGGEKPSPDVTAVLQPPRVNLGLTRPSHAYHTRAQTNTHTEFKCSANLRWQHFHINLYLFNFSASRNTGVDLRRSTWMGTPSQACIPICTHGPSQKQGYKHNQMPLWFHTEVYSHTWKRAWGSLGSSELTNPFIREPTCSLVDFFFALLCVIHHLLNFSSLFVHLRSSAGNHSLFFWYLIALEQPSCYWWSCPPQRSAKNAKFPAVRHRLKPLIINLRRSSGRFSLYTCDRWV